MDGFINLLKPPQMTSSDAVVFVRRRLPKGTKTGHGGTLDPDAAGVLPVCVGKATRLFEYIIDKEKEYIAEMRLGIMTDTQDASGVILEKKPVCVSKDDILSVLPAFTGTITQVPPMYSALKRDGKKLCDLARKGETLELEGRSVCVKEIEYLSQTGTDTHLLRVVCGKGVYIRTLLKDIGDALGCGAHMSFLLRSRAGIFTCDNAYTVEELDAGKDDLSRFLTPPDAPLVHMPRAVFEEDMLRAAQNGNPLPRKNAVLTEDADGENARVYVANRFAGVAQRDEEGLYRFRAMLL